ncbi:MAG: His/Gly/Thr/Pro-type tRNA ligase C-terminal domain-containing protein [Anaerolineae bacterium]|nr:His/Gly/Thr/Pro-type tRNA ligase C-terminal domain-containing protein [Anaerolineae bacterium]MCI0607447.1 His/Gly/Thr/Pro-type tRNA ligase C-terminal domain-containing protein [Anaerolineae bacterium]
MKYRDLQIQTQREAPNNARTEGFSFLVRAGYLTRENLPTKLGEYAIHHLRNLSNDPSFPPALAPGASVFHLSLPTIGNDRETFFPVASGSIEIIHCPSCKYTERIELARFTKLPLPAEDEMPIEKVLTPDCNTIEALANFLDILKEKTAKALMYTRVSDNKFVFVVVRGDMQLSEAKLKQYIGDIRPATIDEIERSGAAAGYASPIRLKDALIVVDDLIPQSQNLVAGANETGYHLKNTNYGRDYSAEIVADLIQAKAGDNCFNCGNPLSVLSAIILASDKEYNFENLLLALAETHHDAKGLTLPHPAAAFDVYLMHIPGKEMDTRAKAEEMYDSLQSAGISVLFDDRDERAGVKFNDADLIGCPLRITVGEKGLKDGMVELKLRIAKGNQLVLVDEIIEKIKSVLT